MGGTVGGSGTQPDGKGRGKGKETGGKEREAREQEAKVDRQMEAKGKEVKERENMCVTIVGTLAIWRGTAR